MTQKMTINIYVTWLHDDSHLFAIFSVIFITFWSSQSNLCSKKSKKIEENSKEGNRDVICTS